MLTDPTSTKQTAQTRFDLVEPQGYVSCFSGFFSTGAAAQQATMVPKGPGKMMLILFLALGTDLFGIWENTKPPHL